MSQDDHGEDSTPSKEDRITADQLIKLATSYETRLATDNDKQDEMCGFPGCTRNASSDDMGVLVEPCMNWKKDGANVFCIGRGCMHHFNADHTICIPCTMAKECDVKGCNRKVTNVHQNNVRTGKGEDLVFTCEKHHNKEKEKKKKPVINGDTDKKKEKQVEDCCECSNTVEENYHVTCGGCNGVLCASRKSGAAVGEGNCGKLCHKCLHRFCESCVKYGPSSKKDVYTTCSEHEEDTKATDKKMVEILAGEAKSLSTKPTKKEKEEKKKKEEDASTEDKKKEEKDDDDDKPEEKCIECGEDTSNKKVGECGECEGELCQDRNNGTHDCGQWCDECESPYCAKCVPRKLRRDGFAKCEQHGGKKKKEEPKRARIKTKAAPKKEKKEKKTNKSETGRGIRAPGHCYREWCHGQAIGDKCIGIIYPDDDKKKEPPPLSSLTTMEMEKQKKTKKPPKYAKAHFLEACVRHQRPPVPGDGGDIRCVACAIQSGEILIDKVLDAREAKAEAKKAKGKAKKKKKNKKKKDDDDDDESTDVDEKDEPDDGQPESFCGLEGCPAARYNESMCTSVKAGKDGVDVVPPWCYKYMCGNHRSANGLCSECLNRTDLITDVDHGMKPKAADKKRIEETEAFLNGSTEKKEKKKKNKKADTNGEKCDESEDGDESTLSYSEILDIACEPCKVMFRMLESKKPKNQKKRKPVPKDEEDKTDKTEKKLRFALEKDEKEKKEKKESKRKNAKPDYWSERDHATQIASRKANKARTLQLIKIIGEKNKELLWDRFIKKHKLKDSTDVDDWMASHPRIDRYDKEVVFDNDYSNAKEVIAAVNALFFSGDGKKEEEKKEKDESEEEEQAKESQEASDKKVKTRKKG